MVEDFSVDYGNPELPLKNIKKIKSANLYIYATQPKSYSRIGGYLDSLVWYRVAKFS